MRSVLQAAADAFGWKAAPRPAGRGCGIVACSIDAGTYVATHGRGERSIARAARSSVERIVCAQDMGIVVNPEGAKMQIEGGITMGLGYALTEELRFRGGEILDRNFDSYADPALLVACRASRPCWSGTTNWRRRAAASRRSRRGRRSPTRCSMRPARMLRLPMTPERVAEAVAAVGR